MIEHAPTHTHTKRNNHSGSRGFSSGEFRPGSQARCCESCVYVSVEEERPQQPQWQEQMNKVGEEKCRQRGLPGFQSGV